MTAHGTSVIPAEEELRHYRYGPPCASIENSIVVSLLQHGVAAGSSITDAGRLVRASFISPCRAERAGARALFGADGFVAVFVDTPPGEAERRDLECLCAKARRGDLPDFTVIDAPYEAPEAAELTLDTARKDAASWATRVVAYLASTE